MSTNISEGLPARKKAAPVVDAPKGGQESGGKKGGTAENSAKRIRQAVYDIRYRARREDIDLKQAFSQYMSNTSMDQKDRAEVRAKLFGKGGVSEQYVGASDDWALESFSKAFSTVFEHHQKDADGKVIEHGEKEELNEGKMPEGLKNYLMKKGKKEDKKDDMKKEGADLFDLVKGKLIDEGVDEKEALKIMVSLSEDELNEMLGGVKGDGYIGHPRLGIKNPISPPKKETKKTNGGSGLTNKLGNRATEIEKMIKGM